MLNLVIPPPPLVLSPRPWPPRGPWRWRWSWSTWRRGRGTQSGPTPAVLMWRNAGWASTAATPSPPVSTPPPPLSATVRGATPGTAPCTATRREPLSLTPCRSFFFSPSHPPYHDKPFSLPLAFMSRSLNNSILLKPTSLFLLQLL